MSRRIRSITRRLFFPRRWPCRQSKVLGGVRRLHGGSIHHEHPPTVAAGQGGSLRANPVRQPPPYFLQPGQRQTRSGLAKGIGVRIEPPPPLPPPPCLSRPLGFPAGGARAEHHLQKHPENLRSSATSAHTAQAFHPTPEADQRAEIGPSSSPDCAASGGPPTAGAPSSSHPTWSEIEEIRGDGRTLSNTLTINML
jgi:hypothetical protein